MPAGEDKARVTFPEKPFRLARVIVEVPEVVTRTVWEEGLAVTLKSETLTVTIVVCVSVPLVTVTVTV